MRAAVTERKLAAILSADVVGYSRLMAEDEAGTIRTLGAYRDEIRLLVDQHRGRIADFTGDNFLAEFPTALDAVECAVEVQRVLKARNAGLPEGRQMQFRIGVHLGDVAVEDDRLYGDGVNIAARLEGLAEPGGVCISADVVHQVRRKLELDFDDLGEQEVKNIPDPVHAYLLRERAAQAPRSAPRRMRWVLGIGAASLLLGIGSWALWNSRSSDTPTGTGAPAIAVLPFDNLSGDPEQAFFADGLAGDLITRLSTWRAFPVIARNSSFQYRGGNLDLKRVGAELGVRYVVEGSVRRAGDRIRVTAQLIDARSGEHVWAETYNREVTDVFALQDEISATIAASLMGDLTRAEGERAHQRGTENLEAWSLYQLGLQHSDRYTLEDFSKARQLFERAAARDPRFATALGQVAVAGLSELILGRKGPREELLSAMMASARRAVELDARDPAAQLGLGAAYLAAGDPKNALESIRRAVDLNPSMRMAWIWLGWAELLTGDPEATIAATERAQRLNPQGNMVWIHDNFALAYWEIGRYDASLDAAQRLVAVQPTYFPGYAYIAMNAVALGRIDDARAAIAEGRRINPDLSLELMQGYFGISRPEIDSRRNDALREAGLE
jgi:TolB-like protein/class 3 adenylate cyclase